MDSEVQNVQVCKFTEQGATRIEDVVAREFPFTIIVNNQEMVTLLCTPKDLKYLAVGFLFSEGLLSSKDQLKKVLVDEQRGVARVETTEDRPVAEVFKRFITSGCGRGAAFYTATDAQSQKVESDASIDLASILSLVHEFQQRSEVYRATGGVHSAALCDNKSILVFNEDIGRHNAVDKVFGECVLQDIPTEGRLVITSGRITSEILLKVAKRDIPIIISKSAPTDMGVKLAGDLGITLLGFARGRRVNAYTHERRILPAGQA